MAESYLSSLKKECIKKQIYKSRHLAKAGYWGLHQVLAKASMRKAVGISLQIGVALVCKASLAWTDSLPIKVSLDWGKVVTISKAEIGIEDCPEPPLYRDEPLHDKIYGALHELNGNYSRLTPWFAYPKLAVAELKPPGKTQTYWDFRSMDEVVEDFMKATAGHPVVFQPGTIPAWMLTGPAPVTYPEDPWAIDWSYAREARINPSTVELYAAYQARLAGWYIKGGFTDELGVWHASGHAYKFAYWEPTNEEDRRFSPAEVTRLYDAVVEAVRRVVPTMKFMGPTVGNTVEHPEYLTYFLNPSNHKPGIPIDSISYHLYTVSNSNEPPQIMEYTIYQQADMLLRVVGYIEAIRKQFLPNVPTDINELGSIVDPREP